jgi:hypothetical protein
MWRSKKAEESLKNSVLDEEAAAKFSTAAALAAGSGRKAEQANLLATREISPEAVRGTRRLLAEHRGLPMLFAAVHTMCMLPTRGQRSRWSAG